MSAKLQREACESIWELSNPNGDETFTKPMFLIAMQLMKKAKEGVAMPNELPPELKQRSQPD